MAKIDFSLLGLSDVDAENYPPIYQTYSGICYVVASAACVWDDLERAGMKENDDPANHVMCVNDMIMHFPGFVEHAYSNNHQYLPKWCEARRDQYINRWGPVKHTHSNQCGGKHTWPWPGHGTSTLNAVYTALALGYDDVRICGAPLDNSPHYFEPPWKKSKFDVEISEDQGPRYWRTVAGMFGGRVTSYSGRTRKLLGGK